MSVIFDLIVPYSWMNTHRLASYIIVDMFNFTYLFLLSCLLVLIYELVKNSFPKETMQVMRIVKAIIIVLIALFILYLVVNFFLSYFHLPNIYLFR